MIMIQKDVVFFNVQISLRVLIDTIREDRVATPRALGETCVVERALNDLTRIAFQTAHVTDSL